MKNMGKRSSKKKVSTIMAVLTVIALLIAGTYAWYDFSQSAVNEFSGTKKEAPSVELVDDFDPDDVVPGANVNKDVYVKNTGNTDVFIRIKLQEYIDLTSTNPGTDWVTHIPGSSLIDCSEDFHDYFEWVLGNKVISMADYMAKSDTEKEAYVGWVYGSDGYAYWSQPLAAGTQTDLLLDAVKVNSALEEYDWYYAINVLLEAVDIEDIPKWKEDATDDGKELIDIITASEFVFTIDTSLRSFNSNIIALDINSDSGNNLSIDWGDGRITKGLTGSIAEADRTHTYSTSGIYTIKITGSMPKAMRFIDELRLISVQTPFPANTQTDMSSVFSGCTNLSSFPEELFAKGPKVTDFQFAFFNCISINAFPENLFANNPEVTTFAYALCAGNSATIFPENLFASCTKVTDFQYVFSGCSFATIPEGIFAKNSKATNFEGAFFNCSNLTSIPENLFANNPKVTTFNSTFTPCRSLVSIPENLFANNQEVTTFKFTFNGCTGLTSIPENLFANNPKVTDFDYTFAFCNEVTSALPELWTSHSSASHFLTFRNCTKASNYAAANSAGWA